jgi:hypothetical protein
MAWGISHTRDAWDNVECRLSLKKWIAPMRKTLIIAAKKELSGEELSRLVKSYRSMSHQGLAECAMENIRKHMTCSVGGHYFFLDTNGYYEVSCDDLTTREVSRLASWSLYG